MNYKDTAVQILVALIGLPGYRPEKLDSLIKDASEMASNLDKFLTEHGLSDKSITAREAVEYLANEFALDEPNLQRTYRSHDNPHVEVVVRIRRGDQYGLYAGVPFKIPCDSGQSPQPESATPIPKLRLVETDWLYPIIERCKAITGHTSPDCDGRIAVEQCVAMLSCGNWPVAWMYLDKYGSYKSTTLKAHAEKWSCDNNYFPLFRQPTPIADTDPVGYFNIVVALCRAAMGCRNIAIENHIARLVKFLEKAGDEPKALAIRKILVASDQDYVSGELQPPSHSPAPVAGVLSEIEEERKAQDAKWGGSSHDDTHSQADWRNFIRLRLTEVAMHPHKYRQNMIEIAALAVAAIESHDRKNGSQSENPAPVAVAGKEWWEYDKVTTCPSPAPSAVVVAIERVVDEIRYTANEWCLAVKEYNLKTTGDAISRSKACEKTHKAFIDALSKITELPEPNTSLKVDRKDNLVRIPTNNGWYLGISGSNNCLQLAADAIKANALLKESEAADGK